MIILNIGNEIVRILIDIITYLNEVRASSKLLKVLLWPVVYALTFVKVITNYLAYGCWKFYNHSMPYNIVTVRNHIFSAIPMSTYCFNKRGFALLFAEMVFIFYLLTVPLRKPSIIFPYVLLKVLLSSMAFVWMTPAQRVPFWFLAALFTYYETEAGIKMIKIWGYGIDFYHGHFYNHWAKHYRYRSITPNRIAGTEFCIHFYVLIKLLVLNDYFCYSAAKFSRRIEQPHTPTLGSFFSVEEVAAFSPCWLLVITGAFFYAVLSYGRRGFSFSVCPKIVVAPLLTAGPLYTNLAVTMLKLNLSNLFKPLMEKYDTLYFAGFFLLNIARQTTLPLPRVFFSSYASSSNHFVPLACLHSTEQHRFNNNTLRATVPVILAITTNVHAQSQSSTGWLPTVFLVACGIFIGVGGLFTAQRFNYCRPRINFSETALQNKTFVQDIILDTKLRDAGAYHVTEVAKLGVDNEALVNFAAKATPEERNQVFVEVTERKTDIAGEVINNLRCDLTAYRMNRLSDVEFHARSTSGLKYLDQVCGENKAVLTAFPRASNSSISKILYPELSEKKVEAGFYDYLIALIEQDTVSSLRYGLLFLLALSSLGVYSIILAGWSSNSKYAFIGALRSAAQMISYEVAISLIILPIVIFCGSLDLSMITYMQQITSWLCWPLFPIAMLFLIAMLAETNRTPFDLPEAEAELVAGYNVDYSSLPFALFFLGEYCNMILISTLFCLLFLSGGLNSLGVPSALMLSAKAAVTWIFFVLVRATLPRYRYDQLMDIGWKVFLPVSGSFLLFVFGVLVAFDALPVTNELPAQFWVA